MCSCAVKKLLTHSLALVIVLWCCHCRRRWRL